MTYKLMVARTLAHLYFNENFVYGFSFPYVTNQDKRLANRIVRLLNEEEIQDKQEYPANEKGELNKK